MPSLPQSTPPSPPIDLTQVNETTRRQLYDVIVEVFFSPTPEEIAAAKSKDEWYQRFTAEESQVFIVHIAGRWFASWHLLDAKEDDPEPLKYEVVRIESEPQLPHGGVWFEEV